MAVQVDLGIAKGEELRLNHHALMATCVSTVNQGHSHYRAIGFATDDGRGCRMVEVSELGVAKRRKLLAYPPAMLDRL
eukprot:3672374-Amphidinium_carterae.1